VNEFGSTPEFYLEQPYMQLDVVHRFDPRIDIDRITSQEKSARDIAGQAMLVSFSGRTTLLCVKEKSGHSFHVGVLGQYLASIYLATHEPHFLTCNSVVLLKPGSFEECTYEKLNFKLHRLLSREMQFPE
jgi:hypothetical protein